MSRSNKESRPKQAVDGGGLVFDSRMGSGTNVKPKDTQSGISGRKMAQTRAGAPKQGAETAKTPAIDESMEGKSGWDKIGSAGASMINTYNTKKKSTTSGGGRPA